MMMSNRIAVDNGGQAETKKKAPATKETKKVKAVSIPPINVERILIPIEGFTAYIPNAFSERSLDDIAGKRGSGGRQQSEAKELEAQNVFVEVMEKIHYFGTRPKKTMEVIDNETFFEDSDAILANALDGVEIGTPIGGLKKALTTIGWNVFGLSKSQVNGAIQIQAELGNLVKLNYSAVTYRRGYGKVNRAFIVYYQPVFSPPWSLDLLVEFDKSMMQDKDVLALFNHAGRKVGIGNNRIQNSGENGVFGVKTG